MDQHLKWKTTLAMIRLELSSLSNWMRFLSFRDMRIECLSRLIPSATLRTRVVDYITVCEQWSGEREDTLFNEDSDGCD